jgi:hypothetical protein
MWHVTYTQGSWVDFLFLVVGSQILSARLLTITCVSNVQMGHANPFQKSTFQELSNDINNTLIQ